MGIMRGFTGLIITSVSLRVKTQAGWKKLDVRSGSVAQPVLNSLLCARQAACCSSGADRCCKTRARRRSAASRPRRTAANVPLEKKIHDSHLRVSRNWTQGRQNGSEKSLTACPVKNLRGSLHGRLQVT